MSCASLNLFPNTANAMVEMPTRGAKFSFSVGPTAGVSRWDLDVEGCPCAPDAGAQGKGM